MKFLVIARTAAQYIEWVDYHRKKNPYLGLNRNDYKRISQEDDIKGFRSEPNMPVFLVILDVTYWSRRDVQSIAGYAFDHGINIKNFTAQWQRSGYVVIPSGRKSI